MTQFIAEQVPLQVRMTHNGLNTCCHTRADQLTAPCLEGAMMMVASDVCRTHCGSFEQTCCCRYSVSHLKTLTSAVTINPATLLHDGTIPDQEALVLRFPFF